MTAATRPSRTPRRVWAGVAAAALAATAATVALPAAAGEPGDLAGSTLYVNPFSTTLEAAQSLSGQSRDDAQLLGSIPSAEWFTDGTPEEVRVAADAYVDAAAAAGQMPVLVAYNLPFRDCAQYSAGGAADTAEYVAWIEGFAAGIGDRSATVILEPDGLGIIPWYTTINGELEWCQPAELDPATAASDRFAQLNAAVDALTALSATSVYLDGTHSGWLGVGDISDRLIKAGVDEATGSSSTCRTTSRRSGSARTARGSRTASTCRRTRGGSRRGARASTIRRARPTSRRGRCRMPSTTRRTPTPESRAIRQRKRTSCSTPAVTGKARGARRPAPIPTRRCGAIRPTAVSASVPPPTPVSRSWTPTCGSRFPASPTGSAIAAPRAPTIPARGIEDPAAGVWFPQQARELIALANPPLAPLSCRVSIHGTKVGSGFAAAVVIRNDGATTIRPWTLSWTFDADQQVRRVIGGSFVQEGAAVTVTALGTCPLSPPGGGRRSPSLDRRSDRPWLVRLNGQACYTD